MRASRTEIEQAPAARYRKASRSFGRDHRSISKLVEHDGFDQLTLDQRRTNLGDRFTGKINRAFGKRANRTGEADLRQELEKRRLEQSQRLEMLDRGAVETIFL